MLSKYVKGLGRDANKEMLICGSSLYWLFYSDYCWVTYSSTKDNVVSFTDGSKDLETGHTGTASFIPQCVKAINKRTK